MSLDHCTKCPLNNKNNKASVLWPVRKCPVSSTKDQHLWSSEQSFGSFMDLSPYSLCISSSSASSFWEKGKKRVEQATPLKNSLRKPERGDCWCLSSPFLKKTTWRAFTFWCSKNRAISASLDWASTCSVMFAILHNTWGLAVHSSKAWEHSKKSSRAVLAQPALTCDGSLMQHFHRIWKCVSSA